jgi:hypothetical protein
LLLGQPVQAVILADDGSGDGVGRLRQAVSAVIRVIDGAFVIAPALPEAGERPPIERVVLINGDFAAAVGVAGQIAIGVVAVAFGDVERVLARGDAIAAIVGICGRIVVGVCNRQ